jgi:hypothetical protein
VCFLVYVNDIGSTGSRGTLQFCQSGSLPPSASVPIKQSNAPPVHSSSRAPLLFANLLAHNLPRADVRWPDSNAQAAVSFSTCPPRLPPPRRSQLCHRSFSNKHANIEAELFPQTAARRDENMAMMLTRRNVDNIWANRC